MLSFSRLLRFTRQPVFATVLLFFVAEHAHAAGFIFPRGSGYYYSLVKFGLVLSVYMAWLRLCQWANNDALDLKLPTGLWNPILLAAGVAGLVVLWLFPIFLFGFVIFVIMIAAAGLSYVNARNKMVRPENRILTEDYFRNLAQNIMMWNFKRKKKPQKVAEEANPGVPVRLIGRSEDQQKEDTRRVARASESKGYKGALQMIFEACRRRATDIHLEPARDEMIVRYRIDGMLATVEPFSRTMGDAVVNIFKVLANMDITEKRKPQDGSFSAQVEDRLVDFRVATAGSVNGEKMVMRILDKAQQLLSLSDLGMRDKMHERVGEIIHQPHGLFVVCGPTGAGKTTTLYACLNEIDRAQLNIITIENPVEYQLSGITQIEVNPKAGKTFADELRSILRQDPDVILIGEIRDRETAQIACQAAQTGHLVLTTLHANDAVTAISRLIDLGVPPFQISSALTAVLCQRLLRTLCPKCKVRYKPNPDLIRKANLPADKITFFYRPPNDEEALGECETCGHSGFYRRTGIFELVVINDQIRDLIREKPNFQEIKKEALRSGMRYLYEDGLRQVIEGRTSIQELLRVSK